MSRDIEHPVFSAYPEIAPLGDAERAMLRRVGSHRDPRWGDWRRRASTGRRSNGPSFGADSRSRRRLAVVTVAAAAALVVGGSHLLFSMPSSPQRPHVEANGPAALIVTSAPATQHGTATQDDPATAGSARLKPVPKKSADPAGHPLPVDTPARPAGSKPQPTAAGTPVPSTTTTSPSLPLRQTASPTPAPSKPTPTVDPTTQDPTPSDTPSATPSDTPMAYQPVTGTGSVVGIDGKCLAADSGSADLSGSAVQIAACDGSSAQLWTAKDSTLRALGGCLTPSGTAAGSGLRVRDCDGSAGQQWKFVASAIVNPGSALCLDVKDGSSDDRTPVISATCQGDAGQSWTLS